MSEAWIVVLFLLLWLVVMFAVIIAVGMYILKAIAFQKIMRKFNYRKSWMAWIPFAQYYALADTAAEGKSTIKLFGANAPAWLFKFWYLFTYAGAFLPFIGPVAILVFKVLILGNLYRTLYARAEKRTLGSRTALGIFSALIELIPIIKFLHYDNSKVEPIEEPAAETAAPVPLIAAVAPEKAAPAAAPVPVPASAAVPAPVIVPAPAPVKPAASPAFCIACGARLVPGAVFCANCGTKVSAAAAPAAETVKEEAAEEVKEEAAEAAETVAETAEAVKEEAEAVCEAAEEVKEEAEEAVCEAVEAAAETAETVQEEAAESVSEAVEAVKEEADAAAEAVAEEIETAQEVASEAAEEIKDEA